MYPVHDVDAILLLSMSLASKRRPAELTDVIAAMELTHGAIPPESKIIDAFHRLSAYGLISECEEGYSLSVDAQDIMTIGQRKKDDAEKRIYSVKENLADYHMNGEHPIIAITEAQWREVVQLHEANKKSANKSLLVPKPKPAIDKRIFPGKRKPFPSRSNKSSY